MNLTTPNLTRSYWSGFVSFLKMSNVFAEEKHVANLLQYDTAAGNKNTDSIIWWSTFSINIPGNCTLAEEGCFKLDPEICRTLTRYNNPALPMRCNSSTLYKHSLNFKCFEKWQTQLAFTKWILHGKICVYVCMCTHTHTHTHICVCTYTHSTHLLLSKFQQSNLTPAD